MGIKERLIRKKRQKTTISSDEFSVKILRALQPAPHKNIARIRRYEK